jgi:predicted acylesterase/phospholipase RssA
MKIWQACWATSAATTFYEPFMIDGIRYSDGGLLYNNPVSQVHAEGSEMFRDDETLLISLGTGIASDKEYNPNLSTITNQLVSLSTRTQGEADAFTRRDGGKAARAKRYFRFDVPGIGDIGLKEAEKLLQIKLASEKFLNNPEVGMKVTSCSQQLALGELLLPETLRSDLVPNNATDLQERLDRLRP